MGVGLLSRAWRLLAGHRAADRDANDARSDYDPDLECFLLQMSVLSQVRMKQRAQDLSAVGFERRQQGYEVSERELDYVLRCHAVGPELRQRWLSALMYTLRCEVERQDLSRLMKRSAALPPPLGPHLAEFSPQHA